MRLWLPTREALIAATTPLRVEADFPWSRCSCRNCRICCDVETGGSTCPKGRHMPHGAKVPLPTPVFGWLDLGNLGSWTLPFQGPCPQFQALWDEVKQGASCLQQQVSPDGELPRSSVQEGCDLWEAWHVGPIWGQQDHPTFSSRILHKRGWRRLEGGKAYSRPWALVLPRLLLCLDGGLGSIGECMQCVFTGETHKPVPVQPPWVALTHHCVIRHAGDRLDRRVPRP